MTKQKSFEELLDEFEQNIAINAVNEYSSRD